ncbi:hypothetical protein B0T24DRAFT_225953 [Lasiosphaeria ovina]|uniref:Secreted protein n=1 Tax=Lasiosphaeria ovina TaxID=92902 RepID=A0AAE0KH48_9PEZI|nr:hypothetical protein B0T24DRAFT_225953 [Lasiosphaeria ovina]
MHLSRRLLICLGLCLLFAGASGRRETELTPFIAMASEWKFPHTLARPPACMARKLHLLPPTTLSALLLCACIVCATHHYVRTNHTSGSRPTPALSKHTRVHTYTRSLVRTLARPFRYANTLCRESVWISQVDIHHTLYIRCQFTAVCRGYGKEQTETSVQHWL